MMRLVRCCTACVFAMFALSHLGPLPDAARAQSAPPSDQALLLESVGIDPALLDKFKAGPIADDDRAAQLTVLSGLRQVTQLDLDRYIQTPKSPADLGDAGRGRLWRMRGRLTSISKIELTDDEQRRLYPELDAIADDDARRRIYTGEVLLDGGGRATIVALRMPQALVDKPKLNEPIGIDGLLVKNAGTAEAPQPVLFTRRPAWYPDTTLGNLGMDYGLYDDVRDVSHDLLHEREAFYQLLATMGRATQPQLVADARANYDAATGEFSVVSLFGTKEEPNLPRTMRGQLVTLVGTARRAVAVVVNDADIQERFGIKKYYEVSLYTADSQQNPLIFNVLELPADLEEGEDIHVRVRAVGTFLTGFYYQRDATPDEVSRGIRPDRQKAPLLIGKSVEAIPIVAAKDGELNWLFAAVVIAAFALVGFGIWRMTRGERRTRDVLDRQRDATAEGSLNEMDVEYQAKPDFTGLDAPEKPTR